MHETVSPDTLLIDTELQRPRMAACYLVRDGDEFALADTGTNKSVPAILEALEAAGGSPEQVRWIMPTHVHLDHAGASGMLMSLCPNATLVVHPRGHGHMVDPSKLQAGAIAVYGEEEFMRDYGELVPVPEARTIAAEDGQSFALGDRQLDFHYSPGHANHHGCIHDRAENVIYTGDTFGLAYSEFMTGGQPYLFATTSPVAFDPDAWFATLDHLAALDAAAVRLTHYGEIRDPAAHIDTLRESIHAHVAIALAEEERDPEGRDARLAEAVDQLLVGPGVAHNGMDEDRVRYLLANDIRLNAQGLGVWLARRARKRDA